MTADVDVAIVGGGAAGIGAARRLASSGFTVRIVEALDRLGGRAWTQDVSGMPLDLGCGWFHSAERNPWVTIAETLGMAVDRNAAAWQRQLRNLGFSETDQQVAGEAFAAFDARLRAAPPASDCAADALEQGNRWNAWLDALSGYINGASLASLSVADYLAYDDAASDTNWRPPEGYGHLVAAYGSSIDRTLGVTIREIDHGGPYVRLTGDAGTLTARAVIVAVPTTVLARGDIRFTPALDDHCHAAACLPLGLADKLFLSIDDTEAVPPESHLIGSTSRACTGSYYLCPFGRPVIECFFGGTGAEQLEPQGTRAMADFAIGELRALLGAKFAAGLRPIAASAWRQAPTIGGSYSHALPGHADARAILATPPTERLAFAGEACSAADFSTAHGALQSGIAAADQVAKALGASG